MTDEQIARPSKPGAASRARQRHGRTPRRRICPAGRDPLLRLYAFGLLTTLAAAVLAVVYLP